MSSLDVTNAAVTSTQIPSVTSATASGVKSNCNLRVMTIEEFNKMAETVVGMARVTLLESVDAFSSSPDCINVKWRPNPKLSPHIAAYKVRYSEVTDLQRQQANSLSTTPQTPFSPVYTEQEYVSEFLSSNSREYSIARLSPSTRYTVCVSAYPSSIEYWAKFGDSMKKCVDLETRPPPDIIAWMVLGLMGFLLIMVLVLAAIVVHRRRTQAQQNRSLRLTTTRDDYETPVVLVAAGAQSGPSSTKQIPPFSTPIDLEKQQQQQQRLQQQPPAYSAYSASGPQTSASVPSGNKGANTSNNNNNINLMDADEDSPLSVLAPIANTDDDEVNNNIKNNSNEPSTRQPILLAAVVSRGNNKPANRPPLAHFTSRTCASQHQTPKQQRQQRQQPPPPPPDSPPSAAPNVTLLPSHNDATTDLLAPGSTIFRAGGGSQRSGRYQHLPYQHQGKSKPGAGISQVSSANQASNDTDTSTSTSGFFGEQTLTEEISSLLHGHNALTEQSSSSSLENELMSRPQRPPSKPPHRHFSQQHQLPDVISRKDDHGSLQNRRQNTLKKQDCVVGHTPPPPPPYDGLPIYSSSYSEEHEDDNQHSCSINSHEDVDIEEIEDDTDGLICVI